MRWARCLAAPIRDYTDKIVAAVSVSGPTNRMRMKRIDAIKPYILAYAGQISGYAGVPEKA